MEIQHLKYFYEVAKHRSFTKAAKSLRISQPSISRTLKTFETQLGITLLHRTKRHVSLTDAGQGFYERCRQIFSEIENLGNFASHYQTECIGDLKVGASDNLCNYLLPDLTQSLLRKYPRVRLKLFSGTSRDIKEQLYADKIEIGLFYTPPLKRELATLDCKSLGFVEFSLIVSSQNKTIHPRFRSGDFHSLPFIGSRREDYDKRFPALQMLESLGLTPATFVETNSQETQKRLVIKNLGYSIVPRPMVHDELRRGSLLEIQTKKKHGTPLLLLRRKDRLPSSPALAFLHHLQRESPKTKWFLA